YEALPRQIARHWLDRRATFPAGAHEGLRFDSPIRGTQRNAYVLTLLAGQKRAACLPLERPRGRSAAQIGSQRLHLIFRRHSIDGNDFPSGSRAGNHEWSSAENVDRRVWNIRQQRVPVVIEP